MNARLKKGLIRIKVPDAGDEPLVEKQRLYSSPPAAHDLLKIIPVYQQSIGPCLSLSQENGGAFCESRLSKDPQKV